MTDSDDQPAAGSENFEEALSELESIAGDLEAGDLGLEAALAQYERGVGLLKMCHAVLEKAERRIELLSGLDADGKPIRQEVADVSTLHVQATRLDPAATGDESSLANAPKKRSSAKTASSASVPVGDSANDAGTPTDEESPSPAPRKLPKKKRSDSGDDSPRGRARALFTDGEDSSPPHLGDSSEAPF